ncbi:MAG: hypothetical protein R2864_04560 [Syntrophotaleaceae bacterium]
MRVSLLTDGALQVDQQVTSANLFGEQKTEHYRYQLDPGLGREQITALTMDSVGSTLYAGTDQGTLLRWDLADPEEPLLLDRLPAFTERRAITALCLILGDISLAVGDADGGVTTWFPVASGSFRGQAPAPYPYPDFSPWSGDQAAAFAARQKPAQYRRSGHRSSRPYDQRA